MTFQVFFAGKPTMRKLKTYQQKIRNFHNFPGTGGECKNRAKEMQARLPLADCCLGYQLIREGFTSSPMDAAPVKLKPTEKIYLKRPTLFCCRLI
jgi:hypothetical protein